MERNADRKEISERYGLLGSCGASVLFHCAALVVLGYSATIYPVIASPSSKEVLWFYPSLLLGSTMVSNEVADNDTSLQQERGAPAVAPGRAGQVVAVAAQAAIPVQHADELPGTTSVRTVVEEVPDGLSLATARTVPTPGSSAKHEQPVPEPRRKTVESVPPVLPQRQVLKELERSPAPVARPHPVETPSVAHSVVTLADSRGSQQLSKESVHQGSLLPDRKPEGDGLQQSMRQDGGREAPAPGTPVVKNAAGGEGRTIAFSARGDVVEHRGSVHAASEVRGTERHFSALSGSGPVHEATPPSAGKSSSVSPGKLASSPQVGGGKQGTSAIAAREPVQVARPAASEAPERKSTGTPSQTKGLFSPPLTGDIKFELVARDDLQRGVRVTVSFRDFARSKRGRPLSRTEARRVRAITPKIVMPGENSIHAIIDHAAEGVYYLRVEHERQQISDVAITIRLFEGTSRARNKTVRVRAIAGNETVVRLMMPEGVVWEDASDFSGSLEDSDSITRFNSDTGVEWKEYN